MITSRFDIKLTIKRFLLNITDLLTASLQKILNNYSN